MNNKSLSELTAEFFKDDHFFSQDEPAEFVRKQPPKLKGKHIILEDTSYKFSLGNIVKWKRDNKFVEVIKNSRI